MYFFADPEQVESPTLLSLSDQTIWNMSPHALACWIINFCNHADASVSSHGTIISGWVVSSTFQTVIEALAQKMLIAYKFNGGCADLPMVTDRLIDDFSWAIMNEQKENYGGKIISKLKVN